MVSDSMLVLVDIVNIDTDIITIIPIIAIESMISMRVNPESVFLCHAALSLPYRYV